MLHHLLRPLMLTVFAATVAAPNQGQGLARPMSAAGVAGTIPVAETVSSVVVVVTS